MVTMLIAYNNDIEFRSLWYHIQTEDNGIKDGHITTTVFHSGQILDSKSTSYREALEGVSDPDEQNKIIKEMMIKQHQMFYGKLYEGHYESAMQALKARSNNTSMGTHNAANQAQRNRTPSQTAQPPVASNQAPQPIQSKPDVAKSVASQASSNSSRLGLKQMSGVSSKMPSSQSISPVHSATPSTSGQRAHRSASAIVPLRLPKEEAPVDVTMAVKQEKALRASSYAYAGVVWPEDDLAINSLALSLLARA